MPRMLDFIEAWDKERTERLAIDPKNICSFGIRPIDEPMIGLLPNDLVVIGADSGIGKSEICLNMAVHNALQKKQVALYFIEGGDSAAMARMKWRMICDIYYSSIRNGSELDYRKWMMNLTEDPVLIDKIETEAFKYYAEKLSGYLHIYSFDRGFTIDDLNDSLGYFIAKESFIKNPDQRFMDLDLIIIDHLQYFTLTNPKFELTEITTILNRVKDITLFEKVPVVLVSHLRKKDKERGLPNQEDFFGTSNIPKIASQAITLSPHYTDDFQAGVYPTFFRFVKSRTKIPANLAMMCDFDIRTHKYNDQYSIHKLNGDFPVLESINPEKYPNWAKSTVVRLKKTETNERRFADQEN